MIVDQNARNQLAQRQLAGQITGSLDKFTQTLASSIAEATTPKTASTADALVSELKGLQSKIGAGNLNEQLGKLATALDKFEISDDALKQLKVLTAELGVKMKMLAELQGQLPNKIKLEFPEFTVKVPDTTKVSGTVSAKVTEMPDVKVNNLDEIARAVNATFIRLQAETVKAIAATKTDTVKVDQMNELLDAQEEIKKGFNILIKKLEDVTGVGDEVKTVRIENFRQMSPTPVTKIDINPLRGEHLSTGVTVTSAAAVPLPGTSHPRRRSIIVFNNHATITLYIGGANVTNSGVGIGLPVLAQTYSPVIDAGPNMILYGIAASGSLTAITLEVSNDYGTTRTSSGNI